MPKLVHSLIFLQAQLSCVQKHRIAVIFLLYCCLGGNQDAAGLKLGLCVSSSLRSLYLSYSQHINYHSFFEIILKRVSINLFMWCISILYTQITSFCNTTVDPLLRKETIQNTRNCNQTLYSDASQANLEEVYMSVREMHKQDACGGGKSHQEWSLHGGW